MCLEAIWGYNIQTLNCVGYDHNWVRGYNYTEDSSPLLPKGTILHIIGYMNNSPANKNVPDPRNWQGSGNRSVANMFIDLGQRVSLTDEQFQADPRATKWDDLGHNGTFFPLPPYPSSQLGGLGVSTPLCVYLPAPLLPPPCIHLQPNATKYNHSNHFALPIFTPLRVPGVRRGSPLPPVQLG